MLGNKTTIYIYIYIYIYIIMVSCTIVYVEYEMLILSFIYYKGSKVLQYFGNMRHNSTAPHAFVEVIMMTNHSELFDAKFTWYSSSATYQIYLYSLDCSVGWRCRIHQLHLCRGVRSPDPMSVLHMTLNNLMVRFQWCWGFGECRAPLYCLCSQVHLGLEWIVWIRTVWLNWIA